MTHLKPYLRTVQSWWRSKPAQDRWIIGGVGSILGLAIWWSFIWSPLQSARHDSLNQLVRIDKASLRLSGLPGDAQLPLSGQTDGTSLREAITASATTRNLSLQRVDQSAGAVTVSLESARFDDVVMWLAELDETQSVSAIDVRLERRVEPGRVSAELNLVRR